MTQTPSSVSNPFVWIMIGVIVLLLIVIKSLAGVLLNAARNRDPEPRGESGKDIVPMGLPLLATVTGPFVNGISDVAFYMIIGVIALEILVILYLLYNLNLLIKKQAASAAVSPATAAVIRKPAFSFGKWWTNVNRFRPVGEEADLDLGHDYDGIRELDNRLPPWWKYGFYITIVFAVIYLWRYHVSQSAPLQAEEYQIAVREAAVQKEAYLKKAANSVDENTVKLLTGKTDLEAGKNVFETTCFACHGKGGEGGVGPNLTDAYWLHGNSINEVFRTIKYGWPEKGMKSWQDDYSPAQIAQIASYVKSLAGTHPPNPKPPQGELVK